MQTTKIKFTKNDAVLQYGMPVAQDARKLSVSAEVYTMAYGTCGYVEIHRDVEGQTWGFCKTKSEFSVNKEIDLQFAVQDSGGEVIEVVVFVGTEQEVFKVLATEYEHFGESVYVPEYN